MNIRQQIDIGAQTDIDPKRARILEGAKESFLAYGYARTTMDDIARAADVSRPALYLLFKNKTDIYRALGSELLKASVAEARNALAADGNFGERVMDALDSALFRMTAAFRASPHGAEMIDMKNALAADIVADWRQAFAEALTAAVADEAARNGVDLAARNLSAGGLADILLDGLEGMNARGISGEEKMETARELVTVIALSLRAFNGARCAVVRRLSRLHELLHHRAGAARRLHDHGRLKRVRNVERWLTCPPPRSFPPASLPRPSGRDRVDIRETPIPR